MSASRSLGLALAAALTLSLLLAVPAVHADEPPPEPAPAPTAQPPADPGPGSLLQLLPDPREWAADVFNRVLVNLLQGLTAALHGVVDGVLNSSLNFITQTPPGGSYASPTVQALWQIVRVIANAGLALIALWGGFTIMVRDQLGSPYHEALEFFPRLIVCALLVNTSLAWTQLVIDVNNALCHAVGQASLPVWERADTASQVLATILAALIYLVTSLLLLLQALMRMALIDVLLVAAPLALVCWALPQTQGWTRLWSTTFFGAVFTQFAQVLALKLGASLITELTPMAADSAVLALFLGVAVLALTLKIPGLMRHQMGSGLGFVRYVAYRRLAGALGAVRAGRAAPAKGGEA